MNIELSMLKMLMWINTCYQSRKWERGCRIMLGSTGCQDLMRTTNCILVVTLVYSFTKWHQFHKKNKKLKWDHPKYHKYEIMTISRKYWKQGLLKRVSAPYQFWYPVYFCLLFWSHSTKNILIPRRMSWKWQHILSSPYKLGIIFN